MYTKEYAEADIINAHQLVDSNKNFKVYDVTATLNLIYKEGL